ncbi:MAG: Asp-tRNA(Asn)/Glu-tRNA(Gln) amidotransferase subunit GatB [Spirochaetales bacterium]|nr:Asp-tRNA(Asn)/Glu-tRNA(Gln) amidotransferase subunit GatB [Spirochaetales bacterium]
MYQSYVGLEIHMHLLARTKVFCGCRAAFGEEPNSNVCPVCLGYPGTLPALNEEAVRMAYLVARALSCSLSQAGVFERKNYFYPDMPKNYQISQFAEPFGRDGFLEVEFRKRRKRVAIKEVHLEEDAGKMIHVGDLSLLDYNRAGTPLLEIVTEPDLEVGEEAEVFLQDFRRMVRYLGVCDGNMEQGSLRCDANVSVNRRGEGLGRKVEIKNLNSFKFVRKALNFEIERQKEILERGGTVTQETRLWNENRDVTEGMRSKESALDYRYFPEPDLPPFRPSQEFLQRVEESLVELPGPRRRRLIDSYGISEAQGDFLCEEKATADYFEEAMRLGADPQGAALWMAADVQKILKREGLALGECPLTPARLAELLELIAGGRIHGKIAKQVLEVVFSENQDPGTVVREKGWELITDRRELKRVVDQVLAENPAAVEQLKAGDSKPMGFFVGEVMKKTSGRAEPGLVKELLKESFSLSFVQVLSMGGAITGASGADGEVSPGALHGLIGRLAKEPGLPDHLRFEEIEISRILSEEILPEDWAALITTLDAHLGRAGASAIVVAHGTDTLAYTASLLFWLFPEPPLPVVLTASLDTRDAAGALREAIFAAVREQPGLYVCLEGKLLSPLNVKFERVASGAFRNWNLPEPLYRHRSMVLPALAVPRRETLTSRLEEALNQVCILKVYPGMKGDTLIALMEAGVRYFVLELYDTGTANLRESPYSLRKAFLEGRERGVQFFCTSQQEGIVDFAGYVTSHELWREGAVPMGALTTESAYTRLLAALLTTAGEPAAERAEQVLRIMEEANADLAG